MEEECFFTACLPTFQSARITLSNMHRLFIDSSAETIIKNKNTSNLYIVLQVLAKKELLKLPFVS